MIEFNFDELNSAPLVPGAVYVSPKSTNASGDIFNKLMYVSVGGGIRVKKNSEGNIAYIIIISNPSNSDKYPNVFDKSTSILTYFGDQSKPGLDFFETYRKGNRYLHSLFKQVNESDVSYIKPFPVFYFEKFGNSGRSHRYIGMAFPFVKEHLFDDVCKFVTNNNINNIKFKFTVNTLETVEKIWLKDLINSNKNSMYSPESWKDFLLNSKNMSTVDTIEIEHQKYLYEENVITSEVKRLTKVRKGQNIIRKRILDSRKHCQICALDYDFFLIASHIVPWSFEDIDSLILNEQSEIRGDLNNVLLLCATHDKLFDQHLITFNENGKLLVSKKIRERDYNSLNINPEYKMVIKEEQERYFTKHRKTFNDKEQLDR